MILCAELDSLADVVSFGVVPAFLCLKVIFYLVSKGDTGMPAIVGPLAENLEGRFCWIVAAIYVACTALRLARFNTLNAHDPDSHMIFRGLPSPGAAGVISASVIFFGAIQAGSPHVLPFNVPPGVIVFVKSVFPYTLPIILLLLSAPDGKPDQLWTFDQSIFEAAAAVYSCGVDCGAGAIGILAATVGGAGGDLFIRLFPAHSGTLAESAAQTADAGAGG